MLHPLRRHGPGTESTSDHVVVRLSGEITSATVKRVRKRLQDGQQSQPTILEIDLGDVTHLSSGGAGALFTALRLARAHGTRMIITHVPAAP
ncbi:anti-sigma factor antagonist [Streptomyces sp. T1317-0309]|nr:anti-sigma factor antagonist [Streptomyces sp. T1317-0309]